MLLTSTTEYYILLTGASDKKAALAHLVSLIRRSDHCQQELERIRPTSPAGWVAGYHALVHGFTAPKVSGLQVSGLH